MDDTHSLIAIQGPNAAQLLSRTLRASMNTFDMHDFMYASFDTYKYKSAPIIVTRCGYTGEDGFEVSVPNERIVQFVEELLEEIEPASK